MIKFLDLKAINHVYKNQLDSAYERVIHSGWYLLGKENKFFCDSFSDYIGVKHTIGVANGLDALNIILKAYEFPKGSEVIVPANTYIATILAITQNNLKPILVEPNISTYNLDVTIVENFISSKTKAIMPVHLYGQGVNIEPLLNLADKYNLKIIEDCAQAHGAYYPLSNHRVGSLCHASGFSFYPGKNLGCLGDGGAICTNDACFAEKVSALRNYGSPKKYVNIYHGINSRLDELQAAFLSSKLQNLDKDNEKRRQIAQLYLCNISNTNIILPKQQDVKSHVWHIFVARTSHRDALQQHLFNNGIETMIHYPIPPHKQDCFNNSLGMNYPITETIHNEVISLPMSPVLSTDDVRTVVNAVNQFCPNTLGKA